MPMEEESALIVRSYELHTAARRGAGDTLLNMLRKAGDVAKVYTFKHRLKSSAAIERKVRRKRTMGAAALAELDKVPQSARDEKWNRLARKAGEDASYHPDHVTDVLGCRFVTLYQSEIPRIVEGLLAAIETYNEDAANRPIDASEFVIYTNRPPTDPLSIVAETQSIVRRSPMFKDVPADIREPESRKSAYSSVHFVLVHDVEIEHAGKAKVDERMPFEIQIRDIFEEGWGEIQHDLLYSEKDQVVDDAGEPGREREPWALHLNALKTFVDGCSQHASIIKANLESLSASKAPTTANQSVSERGADLVTVANLLRRHKAKEQIQQAASRGYTLLMSAEDADGDEDRKRRLQNAAASLDEALGGLDARQLRASPRSSGLTLGYYLRMEAAAARVSLAALLDSAKADELRREAEQIYTDLEKQFATDPTIKMRLGKVVESRAASVQEFQRSEAFFDDAISLVSADPSTGDDHWIAISTRIDKGVSRWKRGKKEGTTTALLKGLSAAAEATQTALDMWKGQSPPSNELNRVIGHKAASNIAYYLAMIVEEGGSLTTAQKKQLEQTVDMVERYPGEPYADWFKTRDNLIHSYRALGRTSDAVENAKANFVELRRVAEEKAGRPLDTAEVHKHLSGSEADCFQTAARVLEDLPAAGLPSKGM